jgi:molybdopterin molybdotransferase
MISEEEAYRQILDGVEPLPSRSVQLTEALNCHAARDIFARTPLPNFDNSAMDGYAVLASDCPRPGTRLRVTGEQPAGIDRGLTVSSGTAIRIFTGAPLPNGSDAVVMQEDVTAGASSPRPVSDRTGSYPDEVVINTEVEPGEFVRRRGCDVAEGQKILSKGERIRGVGIAALAAQGFNQIEVGGRATAAVLSTGDELVAPGDSLEPGQIYDSNSILLATLLTQCGAEVRFQGRCRDDKDALIAAMKRAVENNMLLISGGVSVGQHDLVKVALAAIGAEISLWRVAIKPGKPFLFGQAGQCRIFGLPGNPVSSFVTFLRFVRPAALRMNGAGDDELGLRKITARLAEDAGGDDRRPHYIRGQFRDGEFRPMGRQESHAVVGLSRSDALMRVPAESQLRAGEMVEVEIWD